MKFKNVGHGKSYRNFSRENRNDPTYRKTVAPVIMIIIDKHSIAAAIRDARFPNGYPIKEIAKQLELDAIAHLQAMGITEGTYTVKAGDLKYDIVEDKQGNPVIKAVKPQKSRRNA
jgi:hypothetical protein